jgi:dihydropteroate synthase
MQVSPRYGDLIPDLLDALETAIRGAVAAGVDRASLLVDAGIGFGKSLAHNVEIVAELGQLRVLGRPILLGTSRKSFLGTLTGIAVPDRRAVATAASIAIPAARRSVDVVRVHDVQAAREALAVADAIGAPEARLSQEARLSRNP